ncbi:hypothetical protein HJFPF1_13416 [Paramyrothecium foliicola]|nr:hypothetical protein HJFPF1_13416 [Paramyrothecium foliicola]
MSIPLKTKIAIRDVWSKEDGATQVAIANVQRILGLPITCDPDWALLSAQLAQSYPDQANMVSVISSIVQVWFDAMATLLDGSASEDWIDALLETFKTARSGLRVFLDVKKGNSPSTRWDSTRGGFILYIPQEAIRDARDFIASLTDQILTTVSDPAAYDESSVVFKDQPDGDGWAEVSGGSSNVVLETLKISDSPSTTSAPKPAISYLPNPETMARPDELLSRPPYHLRILTLGTACVEIQCSHSLTLETLHRYLTKWCRSNINTADKLPLLSIRLHHACFGLGVTYDRLTLTTEKRWGEAITISPAIILSLVEGQLGYEKVFQSADTWHFRRDVAFKR